MWLTWLFDVYNEQLPCQTLYNFSGESWFTELVFTPFLKGLWSYTYSTNYTLVFTVKLACCLVFLSAIRGGVPRYRYDFLTKVGWVKFLGLVLAVLVMSLILFLIW